jgi:hypothetical protein
LSNEGNERFRGFRRGDEHGMIKQLPYVFLLFVKKAASRKKFSDVILMKLET